MATLPHLLPQRRPWLRRRYRRWRGVLAILAGLLLGALCAWLF